MRYIEAYSWITGIVSFVFVLFATISNDIQTFIIFILGAIMLWSLCFSGVYLDRKMEKA